MLASYTRDKNLSYTDQALLFGLTSRIKYSNENVLNLDEGSKPPTKAVDSSIELTSLGQKVAKGVKTKYIDN